MTERGRRQFPASVFANAGYRLSKLFWRVKQGGKPGYPRFKSKRSHRKSYKSKRIGTNIKVLDNAVQLPKLGLVKCKISKEVKGRILSATVSQNPSGKYFVALCCADVEIDPLPSTGAAVRLDLGLKAFAITSDGAEYPNHKYLAKSQRKLAKLQLHEIKEQQPAGKGAGPGGKPP